MFTEKQIYQYPKKLTQVGKKVSGWQEDIQLELNLELSLLLIM